MQIQKNVSTCGIVQQPILLVLRKCRYGERRLDNFLSSKSSSMIWFYSLHFLIFRSFNSGRHIKTYGGKITSIFSNPFIFNVLRLQKEKKFLEAPFPIISSSLAASSIIRKLNLGRSLDADIENMCFNLWHSLTNKTSRFGKHGYVERILDNFLSLASSSLMICFNFLHSSIYRDSNSSKHLKTNGGNITSLLENMSLTSSF